ncbi:MAG: hypothetical protein R2708_28010 [Vicinamibacterales bacterium]
MTVLEAAARPIGGLCAGALRFSGGHGEAVPLEQVLLAHAIGRPVVAPVPFPGASGVMMVPIPRPGVLREVSGVEAARAVPGVTAVVVTAKHGQVLEAIPEAASYLGFIFATGAGDSDVLRALGDAHARLQFAIAPLIVLERDGR